MRLRTNIELSGVLLAVLSIPCAEIYANSECDASINNYNQNTERCEIYNNNQKSALETNVELQDIRKRASAANSKSQSKVKTHK